MFGAWGEHRPRRDRSASSTPRSTPGSTSSTPPTSTPPASQSTSSARRWRTASATTSSSPPRSASRWAMTPSQRGASRRRIIRGVEDSLRRLNTDWIDLYQIHRPDPNTDIDETLATLTDLVQRRQDPLLRALYVRGLRDRAGAVDRRVTADTCASAASNRPTRSSPAPSSTTCCPPASSTGWASSPTARWPAAGSPGRYRKDTDVQGPTSAARPQARFDMGDPANQRKLDAADAASRSSPSRPASPLIELALAFVLRHPAVTAAIIGPRTMEHLESQLASRRHPALRRRTGPHRRDGRPRHDDQRRRQRLDPTVP